MFVDVTSWPNETLADLRDSGLLYYSLPMDSRPRPVDDAGVRWNNTPWAYEERRRMKSCTLHIRVEE